MICMYFYTMPFSNRSMLFQVMLVFQLDDVKEKQINRVGWMDIF